MNPMWVVKVRALGKRAVRPIRVGFLHLGNDVHRVVTYICAFIW